jgi:hypothetical protein
MADRGCNRNNESNNHAPWRPKTAASEGAMRLRHAEG